ncbi:MAG: hypothetical protein AAB380_00070 [Verrucomicrobiota bacterium]
MKIIVPVAYVYNPLDYAWSAHEDYLRTFAGNRKRIADLLQPKGLWASVISHPAARRSFFPTRLDWEYSPLQPVLRQIRVGHKLHCDS